MISKTIKMINKATKMINKATKMIRINKMTKKDHLYVTVSWASLKAIDIIKNISNNNKINLL